MSTDTDHQPGETKHSTDHRVITPVRFEPLSSAGRQVAIRVRAGVVLAAAFLSVAVIAAWFVLTAKSIYISTSPDTASIDLSGGIKLKLADRFLVRSGNYQLHISNPGYYPVTEPLQIGPEQDQQFDFVLQRLPGHLRIATAPVDGAAIWIDGIARGRSPAMIDSIDPGPHTVRIVAKRYLPVTDDIQIEGKDIEQMLDVTLLPAWANVSLSSTPSGATVYVNDEAVGQTPMTAEILQGTHQLRIHLSGYKAWRDQLTTIANSPVTIPEVVLELADAVLMLSSSPDRANVTADGEYQGQTPLELALPPGQPVTVRLFKEGYQHVSQTFSLATGDKKRVRLRLEPELSRVAITADPADAKLYVDNKLIGPASQTLELTTRTHRIRISKTGYVDYLTKVTPRSGIEQKIQVKLKTVQQAKQESVKPVIESPGGQIMKLFRPNAQFTMGASRREPGRRANESLRTVELARPFYISAKPVSNAEFRQFRSGHSSGLIKGKALNTPDQPVVQITWEDAVLYCNWLSRQDKLPSFYTLTGGRITGFDAGSNGYRLPSEAEWAWAARYQDTGQMLKFPWGGAMPPPPGSGNYADQAASRIIGRVIEKYNDGFATTAPVGRFKPNEKGLYDLGGNTAEWVHDFYTISVGTKPIPEIDPLGPLEGEYHVIRGSGWAHGSITELRLSFRDYGVDKRDDVGFRVVRYLE